jgi:hypothetical protein
MIWKGVVFSILMAFGKLIVGVCVPVWDLIENPKQENLIEKPLASVALASWAPATLLGAAMVARGEIGLLIIQIGLNETPYLSEQAFIVGIWAIVLNTIIGPVSVGILLGKVGTRIANDPRWGTQLKDEGLDVNNAAPSSNEILGIIGIPAQPRDQER